MGSYVYGHWQPEAESKFYFIDETFRSRSVFL